MWCFLFWLCCNEESENGYTVNRMCVCMMLISFVIFVCMWLKPMTITYLAIQITINIQKNPSKYCSLFFTRSPYPFHSYVRSSQCHKDIIILRQEKGWTHQIHTHLWSSNLKMNKTKDGYTFLVTATFHFEEYVLILNMMWCMCIVCALYHEHCFFSSFTIQYYFFYSFFKTNKKLYE